MTDTTMHRDLSRQLLKFAAGRQMSCGPCGRILDCRTTVHVDDGRRAVATCGECWDALSAQSGVDFAQRQRRTVLY